MKKTKTEAAELEAELIRLNALVRERREQVAKLEACPDKACECRRVWNEVVDKKLAKQVGNVRKQIRGKSNSSSKAKKAARRND